MNVMHPIDSPFVGRFSLCYVAVIPLFPVSLIMAILGGTLIITKDKGNNGYKNQPRTQGYSLGHESAQNAWQGMEKITEIVEWHNIIWDMVNEWVCKYG